MIATLASLAVAIGTPVVAGPINVLAPAPPGLSVILIESSGRPIDDADAGAEGDADCVAIREQRRNSSVQLGSIRWNFGRLEWAWPEPKDLSPVYVLCVEAKRRPSPDAELGGMQASAGMSLLLVPPLMRSGGRRADLIGERAGEVEADLTPPSITAATPILDRRGPPRSPPPAAPPPPAGAPFALPPLDAQSLVPLLTTASDTVTLPVSGATWGGNNPAPPALFGPPITPDPIDMAPVPEPGTWLLTATGLAAAFRAARQRK